MEIASTLGFPGGQFTKLTRYYNESEVEGGGYAALHEDKTRYLGISYVYHRNYLHENGTHSLVYLICFLSKMNERQMVVHNNPLMLNGCNGEKDKVLYLKTRFLIPIAQRAETELRTFPSPVETFRSLDDMLTVLRTLEERVCFDRINRGLYVKVPAAEEGAVLERFGGGDI